MESTYNMLRHRANPYITPTVHMNDGDEETILHLSQHEPAADPYAKYQARDVVFKNKQLKAEASPQHSSKPIVDETVPFTFTFDSRKHSSDKMKEMKEIPT